MKSFLPAIFVLLAASASAADCYRADPDLLPAIPPGAAPVPNGYHCVDHRGQYVQVLHNGAPAELVVPVRGLARIKQLPNGLRRANM